MPAKIHSVVTITDALLNGSTPQNLRTFASAESALDCYISQREAYLSRAEYIKLVEINNRALRLCTMRSQDGFNTSICLIETPLEK